VFEPPMAKVSVVGGGRVSFKAVYGLDGLTQIDRIPGLCASEPARRAVRDRGASKDPRAADHPLVNGEWSIRFYAAAPLVTRDAYRLGAVELLDTWSSSLSGGSAA
jgi:phosphoserine phosphatase RsbU/P